MGDRSFLTELFVLILAATFVCPCSGYGPALKLPEPTKSHAQTYHPDHRGLTLRNHPKQLTTDGQPSKLRGVLDDDPAILPDDSEDWLEGPIGFTPQHPAPHATGFLPVTDHIAGTMACQCDAHAWPIHFLCSYQC